jgi:hypothetical protein
VKSYKGFIFRLEDDVLIYVETETVCDGVDRPNCDPVAIICQNGDQLEVPEEHVFSCPA